jgi:carbon monoxide dehydrogenase subunit G/ketosteroid isomerase-like protein
MASIKKEIQIQAAPGKVWEMLRDWRGLAKLVPGFVTDVRAEEGARVVTFGNGVVARELIVDVDDAGRRLVWSAVGGRMTHHNASAQVFAEAEDRSRVVWIADLLPSELAPSIEAMIGEGLAAMKKTLEVDQGPLAVERRFFAALLEADGKGLAALLTPDFVLVDVMRGSEVPGSALAEVVAMRQLRFDSIDVFESRVRFYGSSAIVNGRTRMRGHAGDIEWSASSRYTHVFVQQDGRWRMASAQGTPIAESDTRS